ncbi:MAG TPA: patatin-like phospholipase family protein [Steroidobacteraceae bacterium]|jgi:NTE family protein|nr:patatin-like phospholipase family protein [Steroidobacteraceae bacterium]
MHKPRLITLAVCLLSSAAAVAQLPPTSSVPPSSTLAPPLTPAPSASTTVSPQPRRLRIGLVLSGGGARGAAHIGVLEMLDRLHVPIDAIAGTSMGAVVGGLYASGLSGREIAQAMGSVDWQAAFRDRPPLAALDYRRKQEEEQYLVNLPLGLQGRKLVIPRGLIQSQKFTETLRALTLPVARITDFDRLPTHFRAVATNLENGEASVLAGGDLATAMRASVSVPGVFAPVEYHGQVLVDGGLVDNLPIDVARAMNVDVLIVVDAGYPLQSRKGLVSLPGITNQVLAILLRRNVRRELASLGAHDLLISPQLGNYSSYDFADTLKIVSAGESAAAAMEKQLRALSVSDAEYARYLDARRAVRAPPPKVSFVRVDPDSTAYNRQIHDMFDRFSGQMLDAQALQQQIQLLYGRGYLETLDYQLQQGPGDQYGLDFTALRNSWGPNYLRLGMDMQDDFEGDTSFDAAGRLDVTELNSLGAEWDSVLQVGTAPLLSTEFYQPLSNVTQYFVDPHADIGQYQIAQVEDGRHVGEYLVRSVHAGLDLGRALGNWGEIRMGAVTDNGSERVSLGDFNAPGANFDVEQYFVRFGFDDRDSPSFARSGQALTTQLTVESRGAGEGADVATVDWRGVHSWARNTLVTWVSGGMTAGGSQTAIRDYFPLGGFLNLSGVRADTLAGPQYAIGRLIYLHKVGNGGEGILDVPAYIGASLESGNVWNQRSQMHFSALRTDFSLFVAADTYLGPAYLAMGYDQSGSTAFYLYLGHSF